MSRCHNTLLMVLVVAPLCFAETPLEESTDVLEIYKQRADNVESEDILRSYSGGLLDVVVEKVVMTDHHGSGVSISVTEVLREYNHTEYNPYTITVYEHDSAKVPVDTDHYVDNRAVHLSEKTLMRDGASVSSFSYHSAPDWGQDMLPRGLVGTYDYPHDDLQLVDGQSVLDGEAPLLGQNPFQPNIDPDNCVHGYLGKSNTTCYCDEGWETADPSNGHLDIDPFSNSRAYCNFSISGEDDWGGRTIGRVTTIGGVYEAYGPALNVIIIIAAICCCPCSVCCICITNRCTQKCCGFRILPKRSQVVKMVKALSKAVGPLPMKVLGKMQMHKKGEIAESVEFEFIDPFDAEPDEGEMADDASVVDVYSFSKTVEETTGLSAEKLKSRQRLYKFGSTSSIGSMESDGGARLTPLQVRNRKDTNASEKSDLPILSTGSVARLTVSHLNIYDVDKDTPSIDEPVRDGSSRPATTAKERSSSGLEEQPSPSSPSSRKSVLSSFSDAFRKSTRMSNNVVTTNFDPAADADLQREVHEMEEGKNDSTDVGPFPETKERGLRPLSLSIMSRFSGSFSPKRPKSMRSSRRFDGKEIIDPPEETDGTPSAPSVEMTSKATPPVPSRGPPASLTSQLNTARAMMAYREGQTDDQMGGPI